MLPIHDVDGAVVAFVGRKHPADTNPVAPKYVNSPTTDLFRKAELPYGLTSDTAEKLRGGADLVLVEGPMDAEATNATAATTNGRRVLSEIILPPTLPPSSHHYSEVLYGCSNGKHNTRISGGGSRYGNHGGIGYAYRRATESLSATLRRLQLDAV